MPGPKRRGPNPTSWFSPTTPGVPGGTVAPRTQTSVSRITALGTRTQSGLASIGLATLQTQTAVTRISRAGMAKIQTGRARLSKTVLATQTSRGRISKPATRTQTALARITAAAVARAQTGRGRVTAPTLATQTGKAHIAVGTWNQAVLPPAPTRLNLYYGLFNMNDPDRGCVLDSPFDYKESSSNGLFSCTFHCRLTKEEATGDIAVDDATFAQRLLNLKTALKIPRQHLLVTLGLATIANWNFTSSQQTAILIQPELTLLQENARDFQFSFRASCQFVDNTPGNGFRRDSVTGIGASMRERRTCTIGATWTSSPDVTAYDQYLAAGAETFFTDQLPDNSTDQHGTVGEWQLATAVPTYNDENSVINATREYWEIFAGRRDSSGTVITTLANRRVAMVTGIFTASTGHTALQNYTDNGDAYFKKEIALIATPVGGYASNQAWVLIDEEPTTNDQNTILAVARTYHETVGGLRESQVHVIENLSGLRTLTVTGTYYATHAGSCFSNYDAGAQGLMDAARTREGITKYTSRAIPKITQYNQNTNSLSFQWSIRELAYPKSLEASDAYDDDEIRFSSLEVALSRPFNQTSTTAGLPVTRLQVGTAQFTANLKNHNSSIAAVEMWDSRLRGYVLQALNSKLGTLVASPGTTIEVIDEQVGAGLTDNTVVGKLTIVVMGGGILWLSLKQQVTQIPGRNPVGMADGTPFSVFSYLVPPEKLLHREGSCEWVVGTIPPTLFAVGDNTVSGFGFIDTGITAQDDIDAQNSGLPYTVANHWMIDGRSGTPYAYEDTPMERGDLARFQTVIHRQVENWRYIVTLKDATS